MIGMDFISFLIILVVALIVAVFLHFGLKYYVTPGIASFLAKVVLAWIGGWLGSPVFGHWWEGLSYGQVYIVPALLGALALLILAVDGPKTFKAAGRGPEV